MEQQGPSLSYMHAYGSKRLSPAIQLKVAEELAKRGQGSNSTDKRPIWRIKLAFDALDLASTKSCKGPLMFGSGDARRSYSTLDVDNGSRSGGPTLACGQGLLRRHD